MLHSARLVLLMILLISGCCGPIRVLKSSGCEREGLPVIKVSSHPYQIAVGEAVVVLVTVENPNPFPIRVKADSTIALAFEVRDSSGGRVAFVPMRRLHRDWHFKAGMSWKETRVWAGKERRPYFDLTTDPKPGDYTIVAGIWRHEVELMSNGATASLTISPGDVFEQAERRRQETVLEVSRRLIGTKLGEQSRRLELADPEIRPFWGLVGTKWSREYEVVYRATVKHRPSMELRIEMWFEDTTLTRVSGLPDCVADSTRCAFGVDRERALELAREAGLSPGTKAWDATFLWNRGYTVSPRRRPTPSRVPGAPRFRQKSTRRGGYVWRVEATLEGGGRESIDVDACDGLTTSVRRSVGGVEH